jgi:hypothetical protein
MTLLNTAVLFFQPNGNRLKQYNSFFHQKAVTLCAEALSPGLRRARRSQQGLMKGRPHVQCIEETAAFDTLEKHLRRIHAVRARVLQAALICR